ncbi:MAG TPA: restriction endonuclease subunit S [Clostridia bacterium]|nr:restriction endonuclease subunit S [Clostridia bacterium]
MLSKGRRRKRTLRVYKNICYAWVQRKLGEVAERVVRKNKNLESLLPLTISAQYGLIAQNEFFDKQIASRDVSGYFLVKKGEFAYNKSYSNGYPWGAVKRLDGYEMGVLSTLYIVFEPTDIDSEFLVQYYETSNWHTEVAIRAAEGARNHGLLNISPSDFFDTDLLIPTITEEQTAIGSFFRTLDDTITLHKRKLDGLKELKSGYLQVMFPQSGETVPRVRFNGFEGEWQERKLEEVLIERSILQYPTNKTPLVSFTVENGVTPKSDRYNREFLVKDKKKKYKFTKLNDIVYNPANLKFGAIARNQYGDAVFSPIYITFDVKEIATPSFVELIVTSSSFIKKSLVYQEGTVYERMAVKPEDFLTLKICLPTLPEQTAIGSFFRSLEEQITIQAEKVEQLKQLKAAYLQKMFV